MDIYSMTAVELSKAIRDGKVKVIDAVEAYLNRIEKIDNEFGCFITINSDNIREKAHEVQKQIDNGELSGPLAGVPIAIKDNICTKGLKTTCASHILDNFVPTYNATVIELLEKAGAIIIGKTNMDEFAMGSTTETSYFKCTKNPWNINHVPGGSSGGSAAAVALEEIPCALGSDTGGSIRQPAAYCGVTGIKPTYGRVSRFGLVAYGSSLDQIGPLGKDITDCATLLDVICAYDSKDSTSVSGKEDNFSSALIDKVSDLKIGIPRDYLADGIDEDVKKAVLSAANAYRAMGATVEEFDLGLVDYAIPAYYVIAAAEASSNLERFDGVKYGYRAKDYDNLHSMYKQTRSEGFGSEVKRRIMLGSFVLSSGYYDAYYVKALKVKALIKAAFDKAFEKYDVILGPVAPTTAPLLNESLKDPMKMYLSDVYTVAVNLTGIPGISLPAGFDKNGMPIGIQLLGDAFNEKTIIRAAYAFEQKGVYEKPTELIKRGL